MLSNRLFIIRTTPPKPLDHDTTIYILIQKIIRKLQRSYDERWKINLCRVKKRHRQRQGRNNDRSELRYKFWEHAGRRAKWRDGMDEALRISSGKESYIEAN